MLVRNWAQTFVCLTPITPTTSREMGSLQGGHVTSNLSPLERVRRRWGMTRTDMARRRVCVFVHETVLCVCVNCSCHAILSDLIVFIFSPWLPCLTSFHQGWSCHRVCPRRWTVTRSTSGTRRRSRARGHGAAPAPKQTRSSRKRRRTRSTARPLRITCIMKSLRSSKTTRNRLVFLKMRIEKTVAIVLCYSWTRSSKEYFFRFGAWINDNGF